MEYEFSDDAQQLRRRLRQLISEHIPADFLGAFTEDPADLATAQAFCRTLASDRLLTLAWPREFGGLDGSIWEQTVVREELWAHHEPRGAQYMGVNWVGPTIMRHGTEEQKAKHLPPIARGEIIWCQGFSEPGAGSDLAALRTAAARSDSGRWVINGQKVWTSYAEMAQWCFLLARTGRGERKHEGITVFLLPMDTPGVEVRPIRSMLGRHHLNEVFFQDVTLDDEAILGVVNEGWNVVREVLAYERVGISRYARCERLLQWAPYALGDAWNDVSDSLKERWALALAQTRAVRLLAYRVVDGQASGRTDPVDTAGYRIAATVLDQTVAEVLMDLVGTEALGSGRPQDQFVRAVEDHWRYAQAATVASGTVEMQRNLIGRTLARHG
jgi:alkylation response protein AidB-like acyl-CoA dehydrogenase